MAEAEQQQPTDAGTCCLNPHVVLICLLAGTDCFLLRHAARKVLLRLDDGTLIGASTTLGVADASTPAVALDPVEAFAAGKLAPGAVTKLEELLRKFGEKFPTRHLRTVDLKRRASDAFNAVSSLSLLPTPPAPSGPGDSPARSMDVSTQPGGCSHSTRPVGLQTPQPLALKATDASSRIAVPHCLGTLHLFLATSSWVLSANSPVTALLLTWCSFVTETHGACCSHALLVPGLAPLYRAMQLWRAAPPRLYHAAH
jgi:hypothetical protein